MHEPHILVSESFPVVDYKIVSYLPTETIFSLQRVRRVKRKGNVVSLSWSLFSNIDMTNVWCESGTKSTDVLKTTMGDCVGWSDDKLGTRRVKSKPIVIAVSK